MAANTNPIIGYSNYQPVYSQYASPDPSTFVQGQDGIMYAPNPANGGQLSPVYNTPSYSGDEGTTETNSYSFDANTMAGSKAQPMNWLVGQEATDAQNSSFMSNFGEYLAATGVAVVGGLGLMAAIGAGAGAGAVGADAAAAEGFGGDAALSTTGFGAGGTTLASGLGAQAAGTGTSLADGLGAESLADPALAQAGGVAGATPTTLANGLAGAGAGAGTGAATGATGAAGGAAASGVPSSLAVGTDADTLASQVAAAGGATAGAGGAAGAAGTIPTTLAGTDADTLAAQVAAAGGGGGSSLLSTIGNIAGAGISALGANSAANTIANAANTAASDNLTIFNEQAALNEPFRQAGIGALAPLTAGAAPGGQFNTPYTLADFQSGPQSGLYNFANAQAQEALKNSTQAGGQNLSSNSAIQSGSLASNLASQYYNTGFNENQATNTMALNTLQGLAGEGQTATQSTNNDLTNLGTTQGNAALTAGNAQAAATQSTANTIGNLLSSASKDNSTMNYLSSLFS